MFAGSNPAAHSIHPHAQREQSRRAAVFLLLLLSRALGERWMENAATFHTRVQLTDRSVAIGSSTETTTNAIVMKWCHLMTLLWNPL